MALGKRKREQQAVWVATTELPKSPGHPFRRRFGRAHKMDKPSTD
jgi:hypothetical protein